MVKELLQKMLDLLNSKEKSAQISHDYWRCFEKLMEIHGRLLNEEMAKELAGFN